MGLGLIKFLVSSVNREISATTTVGLHTVFIFFTPKVIDSKGCGGKKRETEQNIDYSSHREDNNKAQSLMHWVAQ
jgi:hypothetical protein